MKTILCFSLSIIFSGISFQQIYAQQKSVSSCNDNIIHETLVTNNSALEKQGYKITLTKNVSMLNGGIQPVTIDVKKGKNYVVNYIPQSNAKKIKLTIWDKDKNEIAKEKGSKGQQLSTTFTANYTGQMYIFLSQKIKGSKEVCGGISVLEK